MRGSKFPADMHNYIWCPIYKPSIMIIGSVVSEELRWQDFGTDGQTDGVTALLDLHSPSATQVKIGQIPRSNSQGTEYWYPLKGLVTMNKHLKYQNSCTYCSKYMVAYFCHHLSDNNIDLPDNFDDICIAFIGQEHSNKWKKEWASSHTPRSNIAWECCIQWMAIPSIRDRQWDKKGI